MNEPTNTNFAEAVSQVRLGISALNANIGDLGELLSETKDGLNQTSNGLGYMFEPEVTGQVLMELLPLSLEGPLTEAYLNEEEKIYWLKVATYMGPDFIQALKKVAAWMDRAESFR